MVSLGEWEGRVFPLPPVTPVEVGLLEHLGRVVTVQPEREEEGEAPAAEDPISILTLGGPEAQAIHLLRAVRATIVAAGRSRRLMPLLPPWAAGVEEAEQGPMPVPDAPLWQALMVVPVEPAEKEEGV